MILGVDFDSVCNQLDLALCNAANERFGTHYKPSDWNEWEFWRNTQPKEIGDYIWGEDVFLSDSFTLRIPPQKDCIAVLRRLMLEHEVVIISDRLEHNHSALEDWFGQYGLWPDIVITNKKTYPKHQAAKDWNVQLAIDDAPHNLLNYVGNVKRVFCYDQPWNREIDPTGIERVYSWKQILNSI